MKLYLVRHGDSLANGGDNERPLSHKGTEEVKRLANFLAPLKLSVKRMLTSEKLRAKQTASILAASIQVGDKETRAELDPLASVELISDEINASAVDTLLVGHMPFMSKLVSLLVTGREADDIVSFGTATMVCLEKISHSQWIICWMLAPELFV